MVAPPMLLWVAPQWAGAPVVEGGLKPPWNQPHETLSAFIRSPMFWPLIEPLPDAQSSSAGSGSEIMVPFSTPEPAAAPCVVPAIRLSAPGVDGPNVLV